MPVAGAWRFTLLPPNERTVPSAKPHTRCPPDHDTKLDYSLSITGDHPVPDLLCVTNDA
jgi:hypothetical protein